MKKIILLTIAFLILSLLVSCETSSIIISNNSSFNNAVKSIDSDTVFFNDIVEFEWDVMYNIGAYNNKEQIEELIGFESDAIRDTIINDNMKNLIFVKDNEVVGNIYGNKDSHKYMFSYDTGGWTIINKTDNAVFKVKEERGIKHLVLDEPLPN